MPRLEDFRGELALHLTSVSAAYSLEAKGLQLWTQQLTQSSRLSWCSFILVRAFLALMMLFILMWDDFVYMFGQGRGRGTSVVGGSGNFLTSFTLLPQCAYLLIGAITSIWMSMGSRGHFRIAHFGVLATNSLLATIAYPMTVLTFFLYWFVDFQNRTSEVPFLESQNGERIVALGHSLGVLASFVDVVVVEQPLFLGDTAYLVLFGVAYVMFAHIWLGTHPGTAAQDIGAANYGLLTENGRPAPYLMAEILAVFVVLPLCYLFFVLSGWGRSRQLLRHSTNKDVRRAARQRDPINQPPSLPVGP